MHDAIVVGGGIAGLAAAWRLRHRDVLLLEADHRVGGRILSERRGRYWLNYGAHVYGGPGTATGWLLESVGIDAAPVPGALTALAMKGRLLTDGRVLSYPFRIPLSWRDRVAVLRAGAKVRAAALGYSRIAAARPGEDQRVRQQRVYDYLGDRSFRQFVGALPPAADAFFRPTVTRSAGEPEQISAGAGVGYFNLVWDRRGGLTRNIVGGPSTLTETIASGLGGRVLRGAEGIEVTRTRRGVAVRYRQAGAEREAAGRYAVLATPAPITRRIAVDLPHERSDVLERVVYGPYVSAAFLTREQDPQPWDACYAIATPGRAFNVAFNMSSLVRASEPVRQPGSSIMVFSPGRLARPLLERDDAGVLAVYLRDLGGLFPGFEDLVVEARVRRWPLGLAYCFPGRGRLQPRLTPPEGRLYFAGDYLGTFYTETAVQTGFAAAEDILSALADDAGSPPTRG